MKYLIDPFTKIFDIKGKSNRREFWFFVLITTVLHFLIGLIEPIINFRFLGEIISSIYIIPFISLGFRRLNDAQINKYLFLIPFVNLILATTESK